VLRLPAAVAVTKTLITSEDRNSMMTNTSVIHFSSHSISSINYTIQQQQQELHYTIQQQQY
jgi:hypothetical protein